MVAQKFDEALFVKTMKINKYDLELEIAQNPSHMGFYGAQAAYWSAKVDHAKTELEEREAQVSLTLRKSGEKITEKYVEARIKLDPTRKELHAVLIECKQQLQHYENAFKTLDRKQYSLSSLNARDREERQASNNYSMPLSDEERKERRKLLFGKT